MSDERRALRNALGAFATGVTIITARSRAGEVFGMTVNSFASLSLDPPLVLWNLQRDSDNYEEFLHLKHFAVNILGSSSRELSDMCARKGDHRLPEGSYQLDEHGHVRLKDVLAVFDCQMHQRHDGGDHLIIVGKVEHFEQHSMADPLLFFGGRYRQVAPEASAS